ncbi:MAG TPA: 6-bladed beta-propeller, partial [Candidatus Krumholzibacteria bacterium]|nr:6-bladed beta-propeller [Candidatus Krumholzibacteria bacterium]
MELARIGGANTEPAYLFGQITFIAIADDNSVFVVDGQLNMIRHYDPRGVYLAHVGRAGEGPGEYREIKGMLMLPSGELVVLSNPNRLTFFDGRSGAYLRDFTVRSLLSSPRMLECDSAGFVYVKDVDGTPPMDAEWSKVWLKIDAAGKEAAVIPIPMENQAPKAFHLYFPEGHRENFVVATKSALSRDGHVVSGRNDRYAFDIQGDPLVHIERDVEPVELVKEERSEWQAWARRFSRGGETYEIPKAKPAYREIYVDTDGLIWVHRYVAARKVKLDPRPPGDDRPLSTWREPNTFDVF